jgi:hypothetical protein
MILAAPLQSALIRHSLPNLVVDRVDCFLPLVSRAAYIPKVFSDAFHVA